MLFFKIDGILLVDKQLGLVLNLIGWILISFLLCYMLCRLDTTDFRSGFAHHVVFYEEVPSPHLKPRIPAKKTHFLCD